jgi:hypothetical protein
VTTPSRKPSDVLQGAIFSHLQKFPYDLWIFHFGDAVQLSVEAPWRLLSATSIVVTSKDDGQKFGLETPIDAGAKLRECLNQRRVASVEVNPTSSDLSVHFDNGGVFEVVNLSSGYECWTLNHKDGFIWVGRNA